MTDALTQTEEALDERNSPRWQASLTSAQARQQCERILLDWVEQQERRDAERERLAETARRKDRAA